MNSQVSALRAARDKLEEEYRKNINSQRLSDEEIEANRKKKEDHLKIINEVRELHKKRLMDSQSPC
jgi:hypothetical protein